MLKVYQFCTHQSRLKTYMCVWDFFFAETMQLRKRLAQTSDTFKGKAPFLAVPQHFWDQRPSTAIAARGVLGRRESRVERLYSGACACKQSQLRCSRERKKDVGWLPWVLSGWEAPKGNVVCVLL